MEDFYGKIEDRKMTKSKTEYRVICCYHCGRINMTATKIMFRCMDCGKWQRLHSVKGHIRQRVLATAKTSKEAMMKFQEESIRYKGRLV